MSTPDDRVIQPLPVSTDTPTCSRCGQQFGGFTADRLTGETVHVRCGGTSYRREAVEPARETIYRKGEGFA